MEKLQSNFKNILLCLLIISGLLAGILGAVHKLTQSPIEQTQNSKKENALKKVLPDYEGNLKEVKFAIEKETTDEQKDIFKKQQAADSLTLYFAYKNNQMVGCAVETFTDKGFSGRISLLVGFKPDGSIQKIEVLSHTETPGLGDKMEVGMSNFPDQFLDKNPENFKLSVTKDGGDVDAITAATISSRAYCDAVQTAYNSFVKAKQTVGGQTNE